MSEMRRLLRALAEGDEPSEVWDFFARPPVLETPRLIIRPAKMRDAEDVFRYASDPEVARYVLWTPHRTPADSRSFIRSLQRQYRASQPSSCLCVLRETGAAVGSIGFTSYQHDILTAEVGYSFARPLWNRGLATEALAAFLELCFDRMRLHRVEAVHDTDNPASGRVLAHCGMKPEGVIRQRVFNKGQWRDVQLWSLLSEEYEAMRRR